MTKGQNKLKRSLRRLAPFAKLIKFGKFSDNWQRLGVPKLKSFGHGKYFSA
jgi:hypothetical protein